MNLASRMESHGIVGRIQVTEEVRRRIGDRFRVEERGEIEVRGKGTVRAYLIADGGARLNDEPVNDAGLMLGAEAFAEPVKLSAGKKRHALARLG